MEHILNLFDKVRVYQEENKPFLHKPLLLLFALGHCYQQYDRMIPFSVADRALKRLFSDFYLAGLESGNTHYPFGKLENDRLWEVEKSKELKRTSVGHLLKAELFEKNIHGGFKEDIYQALINDKSLIMKIVDQILKKYFPAEKHDQLRTAVGLKKPEENTDHQQENINDFSDFYQNNSMEIKPFSVKIESANDQKNDFIAYLNSLHNLNASGANALAESQALNRYFADIYEPFPLIDDVFQALTDGEDCVVAITGHAGDGKSTVSLDILKKLRGLDLREPLETPLKEREVVEWPSPQGTKRISIVKDMSELTADLRLQWINQAFDRHEKGSWLIISNTGPLLDTLKKFTEHVGDMESQILQCLDQSYASGNIGPHTLQFSKPLIILNMTRLDNVALGARLLTRLINHSAWQQCLGCSAQSTCPLQRNRRALQLAGAIPEIRVRWIYQRLTAYEQRLTVRQMIAHLALSLTGGLTCEQAKQQASEGLDNSTESLANILFSESFFGYRQGNPWLVAENLRAVALIHRLIFGGPIAVNFERQLSTYDGMGWALLPDVLSPINQRWRVLAGESAGVRWRFAQRRMAYIFGQPISGAEASADIFLDTFLQSPRLRDFDQWQQDRSFKTFSMVEQRRFCKACLRVFLEIFSGFSAGQFQKYQDRLYLTLRRPDREIVQPTQLVMATLDFAQFTLRYDPVRGVPKLEFEDKGKVFSLPLPLPLLDYIQRRHNGELGSELARIHLAQLEWFRAELLRSVSTPDPASGQVVLLRAGIDGQVYLHHYLLDDQRQRLERE